VRAARRILHRSKRLRYRVRLFFDLDGTLTDPAEGIVNSLRYALERLGQPDHATGELERWIGPPLRDAFAELLGTDDPAVVERAVATYRERFGTTGILENRVYAGIPEALGRLRESGWELHVVTSKPWVYARRILDHFELAAHFVEVFGSELSGERSRKDELVGHALGVLGEGPRTWMIGDRSYDMKGARAHGVGTLGVLWGYGSRSELLGAGAELLVETPPDLCSWAETAERSSADRKGAPGAGSGSRRRPPH
jgi:phosphoglycolate phosphatase